MTQPQHAQPSPSFDAPATASGVGRFVWHDLMTTDPAAAVAFYTALFGWTTTTMPMGGELGDYVMLHAGGEMLGGVAPLDAAHGVPSHWIGYATVPDVDAACQTAERLGGATAVPPTDIPNVGRFAVVSDPTGATISPFFGPGAIEAPEPPAPGPFGIFCWDELMSSDPEASARFHAGVFGWRYESMDMGPEGTYRIAHRGPLQASGLMQLPAAAQAEGARSHWLSYVHVADVDASSARAVELGGTQLVAPRDIPQIGRFAVLRDPSGALFALFRPVAR